MGNTLSLSLSLSLSLNKRKTLERFLDPSLFSLHCSNIHNLQLWQQRKVDSNQNWNVHVHIICFELYWQYSIKNIVNNTMIRNNLNSNIATAIRKKVKNLETWLVWEHNHFNLSQSKTTCVLLLLTPPSFYNLLNSIRIK